ncbi:hypothetical protein K435DRAFT_822869 [Dendrothele bispora CBS 962.96]|uniref:Uncharacterized protein n=1 Tax=Dendrothele bispora (strain CBS 962.96) TaxID=1314807 RepID=A0A4S8L5P6_DENBC|nr:hypothetical protein K435DRAFT_822869 [Dendrothele bispora CBS 962.96]
MNSFRRLAISEGLSKKSKRYKDLRRTYLAGAVQEGFSFHFGSNETSLQAWQELCQTILGADKLRELDLRSVKRCKAALDGVFVNLVDLVDAGNAGATICKIFSSDRALANYIKRTGKVFPKAEAKKNPLLRRFLIVVGGR